VSHLTWRIKKKRRRRKEKQRKNKERKPITSSFIFIIILLRALEKRESWELLMKGIVWYPVIVILCFLRVFLSIIILYDSKSSHSIYTCNLQLS
jgi:hypothetical protein